MKGIYQYTWHVGRMGTVRGTFVATAEEIAAKIGEKVYFGEILGKHSEIYGPLQEEHLSLLTTDADFIAKAEEYKLVPQGYNPLEHMGDEEEE